MILRTLPSQASPIAVRALQTIARDPELRRAHKLIAGLAAATCPMNSSGLCDYNGMEINCSLIRECDPYTGAVHFEYALPSYPGGGSTTPNVNIFTWNGQEYTYNAATGEYAPLVQPTAPPPPSYYNAGNLYTTPTQPAPTTALYTQQSSQALTPAPTASTQPAAPTCPAGYTYDAAAQLCAQVQQQITNAYVDSGPAPAGTFEYGQAAQTQRYQITAASGSSPRIVGGQNPASPATQYQFSLPAGAAAQKAVEVAGGITDWAKKNPWLAAAAIAAAAYALKNRGKR